MRLTFLVLLVLSSFTLSACNIPISVDPPEALTDEPPDQVEQPASRDREVCAEKDPVTRLCK